MRFYPLWQSELISAKVRELMERDGLPLRRLAAQLAGSEAALVPTYHRLLRLLHGRSKARCSLVDALAEHFQLSAERFTSPTKVKKERDPVSFRLDINVPHPPHRFLRELRDRHGALQHCRRYLAGSWCLRGFKAPDTEKQDRDEERTPEDFARLVRRQWGLGRAPIASVWMAANRARIVTFVTSAFAEQADIAAGRWGRWPFIAVSPSAARLPRLTLRERLATEIGFLFQMDPKGNARPTQAFAESFARAFLVPDDVQNLLVKRSTFHAAEWVALMSCYGVSSNLLAARISAWNVFRRPTVIAQLAAKTQRFEARIGRRFPESPDFDHLLAGRASDYGPRFAVTTLAELGRRRGAYQVNEPADGAPPRPSTKSPIPSAMTGV